ncbi:MAG: efflux RND transporter permease subunit [Gammaproteobacteria bacterium]|nr:efflux RND transporter permease subunit [Gammaproteobacteria bacterium]
MNNIIEAANSRSRTVLIGLLIIIIAGITSYQNIPKESEPEVDVPYIFVEVFLEGVSPEDSERLLVRPLEQELQAVEGIKEMLGSGSENRATVTLEFEADADVNKALADVREKVDLARAKLPPSAEEPRVMQVKFSRFNPMLVMLLGGDAPERTLNRLARTLRDEISGLPGVLEVNVVGVREEVLEVIIDPLLLESYSLAPNDVLNFVEANNRLVAAGSLQGDQGRFAIKVPAVIQNPEDVLSLPIKVDGDRVVRFQDIATVRRTFKEPEGYARINGQPAVGIEVVKRGKSNALETIDNVKAIVNRSAESWPPGVSLTYSADKSFYIKKNMAALMNNVITAVSLVFIVLIGVLGIRNALLVGVAIPGSFCAAFFIMNLTGATMNMVVHFSMIIAVGMLVDGAIVVTELADRRMAEGAHRRRAYTEAAQRMAWPIIASTATTLVAFLPLIMWPGFTGKFLKLMPLTLIYILTASLLMALIFVPTLGSTFGKPGLFNDKIRRDLLAAENGDLDSIGGFTGKYLGVLKAAIAGPTRTLVIMTLVLISLFIAYFTMGAGVEMFPKVEPSTASVDIRARGDLSVAEKDRLVRQVEERIYGIDGVRFAYVKSGDTGRGGAPDMIGSVRINFANWRERRPASEILAEIRERTADIGGIVVETRTRQEGEQEGKKVDIELSSVNGEALRDAAIRLREALETIPGVINAEDTAPMPGIEWKLKVDRTEAARFGADVTLVGTVIQLVTNGIKVGEFRPDDADTEIDIRVRFPQDNRSLDQLSELRVPTQQGNVPIGTFVTREAGNATQTIMRTDMRRTMLVQSDLEDGYLVQPTIDALMAKVPALNLDPSVEMRIKGSAAEQEEAMGFLMKAFGLALALMAMILVTQFNSIFQALLILSAVVFSTGGVLLALLVTGQPFSLVNSGIGTIALAGIVVNNNIVLIDTYNQVRKEFPNAREAIMRACAQRMRPVMLTTITTVLGLMPMALALNVDIFKREFYIGGPGTQWWQQMATGIAGGLLFATFLTLLLTPAMLMLQANISGHLRARRERRREGPERAQTA